MAKHLSALLLACSAALALAACSSSGTSQQTSAEPKQTKAEKAAVGSNCRSIGEGRKINNKGKNDGYMCSASAALNSAEAKEVLDANISVSYGNPGGKTLVSRQVANAVGKTPEETCQRAFLNTVKRFQSTAAREGKRAVRVTSYFDKKTIVGSEYECHIGTWNSRVVLKGSLH